MSQAQERRPADEGAENTHRRARGTGDDADVHERITAVGEKRSSHARTQRVSKLVERNRQQPPAEPRADDEVTEQAYIASQTVPLRMRGRFPRTCRLIVHEQ